MFKSVSAVAQCPANVSAAASMPMILEEVSIGVAFKTH